MYDSRPDTLTHIQTVQRFLGSAIENLINRSNAHDLSKLESPEKETFDEFTPKLRALTYDSVEYKAALVEMGVALNHHYECNSHHPEHYTDGIVGMSLLDLIEMICDWKAATLRHNNGNILVSLEVNQKRYGYSDDLKRILLNTIKELDLVSEPISA